MAMKRRRSLPALEAFVAAGPPSKRYRRESVKQLVRKEVARQGDIKYQDHAASVNVTNSGTIQTLLQGLVRGDNGLNQFQGNTLTPRYLKIDYFLQTQQTYNSMRVLVFQWSESTTPTVAQVLQSVVSGLATLSPINVSVKSDIKILADHKYIIAPTAGGDTTPIGYGTQQGSIYIPARRLAQIRFNSTTSAVASGNIFILYISDDLAPTYPVMNYYSRLAFTD